MFLVLAHIAKADALISGDEDLLSMRTQITFPILSAQELAGLVD